jgi:hypothetical protein
METVAEVAVGGWFVAPQLSPQTVNNKGVDKETIRRGNLMLCYAVLCCAVLCCAVLCCAVLCCAVLCCAVLCHNFTHFSVYRHNANSSINTNNLKPLAFYLVLCKGRFTLMALINTIFKIKIIKRFI